MTNKLQDERHGKLCDAIADLAECQEKVLLRLLNEITTLKEAIHYDQVAISSLSEELMDLKKEVRK